MDLGLIFEEQLEGKTKFSAWKERINLLLEEHEIWDIVKDPIIVPIDITDLVSYVTRER